MKPENKAFLDANRHHHTTLVQAEFMRHLNGPEREGMQRVMREEFRPGYTADLWCPPCVADMVLMLYRHYDEWLLQNPEREGSTAPPPIKANFPSHKKHHRK